MTDRLTQLQQCLDQLVTQLFSSINYINVHHDLEVPQGAPAHATKLEDPQVETVPTAEFQAALDELARDVVAKAKQIETLIGSLPELDAVNTDFVGLEVALAAARREESAATAERDELVARCDALVRRLAEYRAGMDAGESAGL